MILKNKERFKNTAICDKKQINKTTITKQIARILTIREKN